MGIEHTSPDHKPLCGFACGEFVADLAWTCRGHLFCRGIYTWYWSLGQRGESRDGIDAPWRPPAAVCFVNLFAGFALDDGPGSRSAMSELVLKHPEGMQFKNRRLGLILALLTLLYIAAVIAFIIIY